MYALEIQYFVVWINALVPFQGKAIIKIKSGFLLIGHIGTEFSETIPYVTIWIIENGLEKNVSQNGNHFISSSLCFQRISTEITNCYHILMEKVCLNPTGRNCDKFKDVKLKCDSNKKLFSSYIFMESCSLWCDW